MEDSLSGSKRKHTDSERDSKDSSSSQSSRKRRKSNERLLKTLQEQKETCERNVGSLQAQMDAWTADIKAAEAELKDANRQLLRETDEKKAQILNDMRHDAQASLEHMRKLQEEFHPTLTRALTALQDVENKIAGLQRSTAVAMDIEDEQEEKDVTRRGM
jgi:predicted  nucleic acid-binding Zn-ribbon protein